MAFLRTACLFVCLVLVIFSGWNHQVQAECCSRQEIDCSLVQVDSHGNKTIGKKSKYNKCLDFSHSTYKIFSVNCGVGSCDVTACNCDGGCRPPCTTTEPDVKGWFEQDPSRTRGAYYQCFHVDKQKVFYSLATDGEHIEPHEAMFVCDNVSTRN